MENAVSAPLIVFPDAEALATGTAERFADVVRGAVGARGRAVVALTGGTTPRLAYARLAQEPFRSQIPWERVHFFWGDERSVPPHHPRSNFGMAWRALLAHVGVPAENVHRMRGEWPAERAAHEYEQELRDFWGSDLPQWDLLHLGLGENAHIASLFPFSSTLRERDRWVTTALLASRGEPRVTLTLPALRSAALTHFLVSGAAKAAPVRAVLQEALDPFRLPAQEIRPEHGPVVWLLDSAAAAALDPSFVSSRTPSS